MSWGAWDTQGSIALDGPWAGPRNRRENTLLVVGDERVHRLADAARRGLGWAVMTFDPLMGSLPPEPWQGVVIDSRLLKSIREDHPNILRRAERIWVVPAHEIEDKAANPFDHPLPLAGRVFKRVIDITLALFALVLVLPVLLVSMAAVRLDSPGPALFRQVRVGANGKRFWLYKLRTMRHGADDRVQREYAARLIAGAGERHGAFYKLAHDPRITRVGRFLRRRSIDELPQLWNVLTGSMSLVGPRPPLPHETELYAADAWARLRVKPGVTGLWQVSGRSELSFTDMVALDVRYWQTWSPLLDTAILLKTPAAVLSGRGAV